MYKTKEIKESFTEEHILHFLARLGSSEFRDGGEYFSFKTVCHNINPEEAGFNLVYYKDSKLFRCFSECGQSFDVFGLAQKYFELREDSPSFNDIYYFVLNYSPFTGTKGIDVTSEFVADAPRYRSQDIEFILPEYSDSVLEAFSDYLPIEWQLDGITQNAYSKYNIKYSISRNAIIIPHYDARDRLVGVRQRPLDEEVAQRYGKYRPLYIESTLYSHPLSFNLYGLNKAKEAINNTGIVLIAEGEKSCLQAETLLPKNVTVAACGSSINKWQVLQILKHTEAKEIVLAFDKEEEDKEATYFNKLRNLCKRYNSYINISFIYDNWDYLKLKESPFDRDAETLKNLIQKRVRVK